MEGYSEVKRGSDLNLPSTDPRATRIITSEGPAFLSWDAIIKSCVSPVQSRRLLQLYSPVKGT